MPVGDAGPAAPAVRYRERLLPRWPAIAVILGLIAMLAIAYGAAFGATLGWLLASALTLAIGALAYRGSPTIEVTDEAITAGGARLPRQWAGQVRLLDSAGMRIERGPNGDARRYVVLRPWAARGGILLDNLDPQDPHPAWLLSSRDPQALASALGSPHPAG